MTPLIQESYLYDTARVIVLAYHNGLLVNHPLHIGGYEIKLYIRTQYNALVVVGEKLSTTDIDDNRIWMDGELEAIVYQLLKETK